MADPLSIIASIIAVAGAGISVSTALYTYSSSVSGADKSARDIAQDISLTSSVLQELANLLKQEEASRICSENAAQTAKDAIEECQRVFDDINTAISGPVKAGKVSGLSKFGRLKWPLTEKKVLLLRSNLERLKSTVVLLLTVLNYARSLKADEVSKAEIRQLLLVNKENQERFLILQKSVVVVGDKEAVRPDSEDIRPPPYTSTLVSQPPVPSTGTQQDSAAESEDIIAILKCAEAVQKLLHQIEASSGLLQHLPDLQKSSLDFLTQLSDPQLESSLTIAAVQKQKKAPLKITLPVAARTSDDDSNADGISRRTATSIHFDLKEEPLYQAPPSAFSPPLPASALRNPIASNRSGSVCYRSSYSVEIPILSDSYNVASDQRRVYGMLEQDTDHSFGRVRLPSPGRRVSSREDSSVNPEQLLSPEPVCIPRPPLPALRPLPIIAAPSLRNEERDSAPQTMAGLGLVGDLSVDELLDIWTLHA